MNAPGTFNLTGLLMLASGLRFTGAAEAIRVKIELRTLVPAMRITVPQKSPP